MSACVHAVCAQDRSRGEGTLDVGVAGRPHPEGQRPFRVGIFLSLPSQLTTP